MILSMTRKNSPKRRVEKDTEHALTLIITQYLKTVKVLLLF